MRWVILTILALTSVARGEVDPFDARDPHDAGAAAAFAKGRELLADGHEDEACPQFAKSLQLERAPSTAMNVALCKEHQNQLVDAIVLYEEAVAQLRAGGAEDRAKFAQSRADLLMPRISIVVVQVPEAGTKLQIGDREFDAPATVLRTRVMPGSHPIIALTVDGRESRAHLDAVAGQTEDVTLPPFQIRRPEATTSGRRKLGWVIAAGIVATIGVSAMLAGLQQRDQADRDLASGLAILNCTADGDNITCDSPGSVVQAQDIVTSSDSKRTQGLGFVVVGSALAITGVGLFVFAPRKQVAVEPTVTATSAGVSIVGRF